jgi:hypothetical protein
LTDKTSKNQLTLPKEIAKETKPMDADLATIRAKMGKLGISPADVSESVKRARVKSGSLSA